MFIGYENKDYNWMQKLMSKKEKIIKNSKDNLLIIGSERDGNTTAGTLLAALTTKKPVFYLEYYDKLKDNINDFLLRNNSAEDYGYIAIDLNLLDFKTNRISDIEKVLSVANITMEQLKRSKFVHIYDSSRIEENKKIYFNAIYSQFIVNLVNIYLEDKQEMLFALDEMFNSGIYDKLELNSKIQFIGNIRINDYEYLKPELLNKFTKIKIHKPISSSIDKYNKIFSDPQIFNEFVEILDSNDFKKLKERFILLEKLDYKESNQKFSREQLIVLKNKYCFNE